MIRSAFLVCAMLAAPMAFAEDISGFWKHTKQPGWIEVNLDEGVGTVVRNDKFPERVGRKILKDLQADDSGAGVWKGQVYAERAGEYKDATITLTESDTMEINVKVGFMSRTLVWKRVAEVPAAGE